MKDTTARGLGLVLGIVLFLVLALVGCSSVAKPTRQTSRSVSTGASVTMSPVVETSVATTEASIEEEIVEEEAIKEEEIVEEKDPLAGFLVTEDVASGTCLLRDGKIYKLSDKMKKRSYGYEEEYGYFSHDWLYLYRGRTGSVNYDKEAKREDIVLVSCGPVPVPVVEEGDKIVAYSSNMVPKLMLYPAEFGGYTLPIFYYVFDGYNPKLDKVGIGREALSDTDEFYDFSDIHNLTISDLSEIPVEDRNLLNQGEQYIVSWFTGTKYEERQYVADCLYYVIFDHTTNFIEIEGTLTKEGYVEFDVSSVPPGIYMTLEKGLIEIP